MVAKAQKLRRFRPIVKLCRSVVAWFLAFPVWVWPAAADETVWPERHFPALDSFLTAAAEKSPRMIRQTLELEIAEQSRLQARAGLLPTVTSYARLTEARDHRADLAGTTAATKMFYDVTLTQPVFHWGERRNSARIGEITKLIAERNYREAYRHLAQEIRRQYLLLIVQKLALTKARIAQQQLEQELQSTRARRARGEVSDATESSIGLRFEHGQVATERAELEFAMARRSFSRLVALPELEEAAIPDEIPALHYPADLIAERVEAYLGAAEQVSQELANLTDRVEIEELNHRIQKARLKPKLSFVLGVTQDEQSYTINTAQRYQVTSAFAGVSISWTLFDGFDARSGAKAALARRRQVEGDLRHTKARLPDDLHAQQKMLELSARGMELQDRGLRSSEVYLREKRADLERGLASEAEVAAAELAVLDARIAAYHARIDYTQKFADLLGAMSQDPAVGKINSGL